MTLNEAINILKSDNDYNKSIGCNTSYEEQLVEWLEELKEYKKNSNTCPMCDTYCSYLAEEFENGYNNAIDDFVKFANTFPTVEEEDGTIRPMWLEEMAEQLKEGVKNE